MVESSAWGVPVKIVAGTGGYERDHTAWAARVAAIGTGLCHAERVLSARQPVHCLVGALCEHGVRLLRPRPTRGARTRGVRRRRWAARRACSHQPRARSAMGRRGRRHPPPPPVRRVSPRVHRTLRHRDRSLPRRRRKGGRFPIERTPPLPFSRTLSDRARASCRRRDSGFQPTSSAGRALSTSTIQRRTSGELDQAIERTCLATLRACVQRRSVQLYCWGDGSAQQKGGAVPTSSRSTGAALASRSGFAGSGLVPVPVWKPIVCEVGPVAAAGVSASSTRN